MSKNLFGLEKFGVEELVISINIEEQENKLISYKTLSSENDISEEYEAVLKTFANECKENAIMFENACLYVCHVDNYIKLYLLNNSKIIKGEFDRYMAELLMAVYICMTIHI